MNMPGGDRTGPAGFGPKTGRAAGYCAGYGAPGFANPVLGRGFGMGWGRGGGRGWRNCFYATGWTGRQRAAAGWPLPGWHAPNYAAFYPPTATREQEVEGLKNQAEYLEDSLAGIRKRIEELEAKNKGS
jgi:hypothetical protein